MRTTRVMCAAFLISAMFGGSLNGSSVTEDTVDISVAVFKHLMAGATNFKVFCLVVDSVDPSDDLLARFGQVSGGQRILPNSNCTAGEEAERDGVKERESQTRAMVLAILTDSLVWKDAETVEIAGGYYRSARNAAKYIFTVKKRGVEWVVASEQLEWIA